MEKYTYEGVEYVVPKYEGFPCCGSVDKEECPEFCGKCIFATTGSLEKNVEACHEYVEVHDLTKLRVPFGLLPKETQERLKKAWNGVWGNDSNIQFLGGVGWDNVRPSWSFGSTYRLDPEWKPEPVIKITKDEVFKILKEHHGGKNVEITE